MVTRRVTWAPRSFRRTGSRYWNRYDRTPFGVTFNPKPGMAESHRYASLPGHGDNESTLRLVILAVGMGYLREVPVTTQ